MLTSFYESSFMTPQKNPSSLILDVALDNSDGRLTRTSPTSHMDSDSVSPNHFLNCESEFLQTTSSESMGIQKPFRLLEFEKRNLKCPQCTYMTDRKNNLKRHIVTMHQECPKTLDCCGMVFRSKAALREHVSFHHRGGYRCQICGRNFCRKALLRRHLTVHSGQKDYRCHHCAYATSHKSNLERHQKVHLRSESCKTADQQGFNAFNEQALNGRDGKMYVSAEEKRWRLHAKLEKQFYKHHANFHQSFQFPDHVKHGLLESNKIFTDQNFNALFQFSVNSTLCPTDSNEDNELKVDSDGDDAINSKDDECFREVQGEEYRMLVDTKQEITESSAIDNSWFYYPCENKFSSYVQGGLFSDEDADENQKDSSDVRSDENYDCENDAIIDDKSACRRRRLSQNPYKCSACGSLYTNQRHFLKHGCGKVVRQEYYFPVTNMIKKGVALAEIKNNMLSNKDNNRTSKTDDKYSYMLS